VQRASGTYREADRGGQNERGEDDRLIWQKVKSSWFRGSGYFSIREESESLTRAGYASYAIVYSAAEGSSKAAGGGRWGEGHCPPDNASESSLHSGIVRPLSPAVREYPEIRAHRHDLPERHSTGFRRKREILRGNRRQTGEGESDRPNRGKTEDRARGLARAIGSIPSSR